MEGIGRYLDDKKRSKWCPTSPPRGNCCMSSCPKIFDLVYIKNQNFAADPFAFNLLSEMMHLLKLEMHKGLSVSHTWFYKPSFVYTIYMHAWRFVSFEI